MIKNIIFDIGNVLVAFNWQDYLDSFGFPEEETRAIAAATFAGPYWILVDEGKLSYEELEHLFISQAPAYAQDISRVFAGAPSCITQYPHARPWLSSLKKEGLNLYYLSNYGEITRENTKAALDFCPLMDGGIMSYEVRLVKPDPAIYKCLFDKYNLLPTESVFIDDNKDNIRQAQSLGLHTILFTDYSSAVRELKEIRLRESNPKPQ